MLYTVFFDENSNELPQDFASYSEAKAYAEERVSNGLADMYNIESCEGELI